MNLPKAFIEKMKTILGDEFDDFMKSYEAPRNFGLRVNTAKLSAEEFERIAPFHLTQIPWVENGYYYEEQDAPARHPFYYAGMYYLQEPSAMTPASRLQVLPGEKVLDLCAAPGGKATELGAKLRGEGLLVANDISASRAKALLKNVEVFGIPNSFITNEIPGKLSGQFEEFFDKILVDAPCSGEGMFRKDPAVAKVWDKEKPLLCAKQQKVIIMQAAKMLRPGGQLLYSTCTFSPEENEEVIQYLLSVSPEFEIREMPGYEGFSEGRPDLVKDGGHPDLRKCIRIWPHKMSGEGHFIALLSKGKPTGTDTDREHVKTPGVKLKIAKADLMILDDFLKDISMDMDMNDVEVRKGQVYYVPKLLGERKGLTFLRNGLYLGELKKDRFEPSQSFAMALGKGQYVSCVNLNWSDSRVGKYLRGETIYVDDLQVKHSKGWQLVCISGFPLGWGKLVNGTLKNKYHPGWRMK
ncbi:RsmF rRNA methyltransferase first C-terminal domain-containing protein [Robinsoniella sp.]|uniref:RsmF rRNA methyltransferase first C-terminal domain-containing protein n=1 Tax=Robinsoniella sp. TaxID=2496533 RepID=UPI003750224B